MARIIVVVILCMLTPGGVRFEEAVPVKKLTGCGYFTSPNYPNDYPTAKNVQSWQISEPWGHVVQLKINDFALADDPLCGDQLEVFDGTVHDEKHRIYYRCGSKVSWQTYIQSTLHNMAVKFITDGSTGAKGFNISYCHTQYKEEFLLAADHSSRGILRLNMLRNLTSRQIIPNAPNGRLVGEIEFDPIEAQIFFTDEETKTLWRIGTDGSHEEPLVEGLNIVHGLALNRRSRNLYFVSNNNIVASDLDGEKRYIIGEVSTRTKELVTDYINSYLYWIAGSDEEARIVWSHGDGTSRDFMEVDADLGDPVGLTVHYSSE